MKPPSTKFGLGKLAYNLYYRPLASIANSLREGGPLEQWRTERGRRRMEATAGNLTPLPAAAAGDNPLVLHILTGRRFWYQTAFCLWSFARQARRPIAPMIYDDGSLAQEWRAHLARVFPAARFVSINESLERLDALLPDQRFPALRERWLHYPHLRKLTDVHAGGGGWKISIDSDLLFFHRPQLVVDWLDHPTRPLHAMDVQNAYGYPLEMLGELAGRPVPERLNTGLCGLRSQDIDWEQVEHWCRTLIGRAGTSYFLEQALVALLLSGRDCTVAPREGYVTLPHPPEAHECRAIMHHYVAESKRWYFRTNWKRTLEETSQAVGGGDAHPADPAQ